jgi:hypothetical protein
MDQHKNEARMCFRTPRRGRGESGDALDNRRVFDTVDERPAEVRDLACQTVTAGRLTVTLECKQ